MTQEGSIDAGTLKGMLGRDEDLMVVDVRKREEHERGSVPGAVSFDAYDRLNAGEGGPWRGWRCRKARGL